ncbi:IS4 family transposase [Radiobacillus sp. PE A8.2]|uniref:IS4 family transposase n=1 Tax=Radiobacillus sp. PE A8.2 TaxID=3380349 RepID=UPI00389077D5
MISLKDIRPFAEAIYSTISKSALRRIARDTKFVQRKGKLKPEDFLVLCSLSADSVSDESLHELCGTLSLQSKTSLSKQALDSRFNDSATAFLKEIFFQLLSKQDWFVAPIDENRMFSRIRIMDATSFQLPNHLTNYLGTNGSGVKVQFECEWYQGRFLHTSVHHGKASDRKAALDVEASLRPEDLCLRDLGYYSAENLKKIDKQGASYISRIPTNTKLWLWDTHRGWLPVDPMQDAENISPFDILNLSYKESFSG